MAVFQKFPSARFLALLKGRVQSSPTNNPHSLSVVAGESESIIRSKRGASSISLGPPVVYKGPGNHTVEVGQDFQFYCKIKANPLAHVAMKHNPDLNNPISVRFTSYGELVPFLFFNLQLVPN